MDEVSSFNKIWDALEPFPTARILVTLFSFFISIYIMVKAIKDKNNTKPAENFTAPPWLIEKMMDETRSIKSKCDSIEYKCDRTYEKSQETKQLVEFMRNEFHLRKS